MNPLLMAYHNYAIFLYRMGAKKFIVFEIPLKDLVGS